MTPFKHSKVAQLPNQFDFSVSCKWLVHSCNSSGSCTNTEQKKSLVHQLTLSGASATDPDFHSDFVGSGTDPAVLTDSSHDLICILSSSDKVFQ